MVLNIAAFCFAFQSFLYSAYIKKKGKRYRWKKRIASKQPKQTLHSNKSSNRQKCRKTVARWWFLLSSIYFFKHFFLVFNGFPSHLRVRVHSVCIVIDMCLKVENLKKMPRKQSSFLRFSFFWTTIHNSSFDDLVRCQCFLPFLTMLHNFSFVSFHLFYECTADRCRHHSRLQTVEIK